MNRSRTRSPLLAAAILAFAACGDSTAPAGTPSTVTVRVYVDSDGSGTFSAGDVAVGSAPVVLQSSDGGATQQATTGADGIATFPGVVPGSYRVAFPGAAPAGAVLASATEPVVAAPYRGGNVEAEFRFVFNPGHISGVLYRDNNNNNQYDPNVDTPAPGIPVRLIRAPGDTVAFTTTDAAGIYRFDRLRPGTYTLAFSPLPTMQIVGGNTATVQVTAAETSVANTRFTGELIVPIAQARQSPAGSVVTVEGIATVGVGVFSASTTGNQFNVQDPNGGILVLQVPLSSGIQQGDSVRVTGTTAISAGEYLITGNPTVVRLASNRPVPVPHLITATQAAASTANDPLQGLLVRVEDVRVESVGAGSGGYNVAVTGQDGATFIVRVSLQSIAPQSFWQVGARYNIVGTLAQFNGAQVKVRSAADITPAGPTVALARTRAVGDTVLVEGVVTARPGMLRAQGDNMYIQDATGGIQVFNVPAGLDLALGDRVRVHGLMGAFSGEAQVVRFSATNPLVVTRLGTATVPAPRLVTALQVADHSYEGQLVRMENLMVTAVGTASSAGAYTVTTELPGGGFFQIRIESSAVGIPPSFWTVGTRYDVTGIMSRFNATPQLKPRQAADATPR